jgi:VanZ family protein
MVLRVPDRLPIAHPTGSGDEDPAPPGVEHAFAYGVTAGLLVLGYSVQPVWLIIGALSAYSGLMELLQTFSPGRHPGLDGMLWSSAGTIFGGLLVALLQSRVR